MSRRIAIERVIFGIFAAFMLSVPWSVPAVVSPFWVSIITEILIWSLFAASVNLLLGYVGLLSFGQALYFGFGMYGVSIGIDLLHLGFWPVFALGIVAAMAMAGGNTVALSGVWRPFDAYPYIFLNLILSMLAALQAPVIMMSQNRHAAKDRAAAAHDYEVNLKSELEILALHQKVDALREQQWAELVAMQQEQIKLLTRLCETDEAA